MTAYDAETWHDLFVAAAGAAAALDGLLFVAASINIKEILASPGLPALAARTLALLLGQLVMSLAVLIPGQSRIVLGVELLVLGLALIALTSVSIAGTHRVSRRWRWTAPVILLAAGSTLPMAIAGVSLIACAGGGLYWAFAELVAAFVVGVYNVWILLIEILR